MVEQVRIDNDTFADASAESSDAMSTPQGAALWDPERRAVVEALSAQVVARGGRVWRRVVSDSMAPVILPGDRILVERCDVARAGDIVVFRSPAGLMAHRVVWVRRRGPVPLVLEKGDANPFATAIAAEAIVGRVCRLERDGRSLDLLHGRARGAQIAAAYLSLLEFVAYTAGRAVRHILRLRPTGAATRVSAALRGIIAWLARPLGPR